MSNKKKKPWFKFYPTDWRADENLRMCSAAARGLWIELLCIMSTASPVGHLIINGKAPTDMQIAMQTGIPSDQIPALLGELEKEGVFSRNREGIIYSRKMIFDAKKAQIGRKNGLKGGAPKHRKNNSNSGVGYQNGNQSGNPPPTDPESRVQNIYNNNISDNGTKDPPSERAESSSDGYWFKGEIIKLKEKDYREMIAVFGTDGGMNRAMGRFDEYLRSRDQWYQGQHEGIQRRWYLATWADIRKRKQ